ncbi:MAG: dihydroorotate dehydrogenase-like protein [Bacteroidota bacterium]|nr:dihydroorotate dehydrogenase-like protein [Bacteroidota bacterium]
MDISVKYMGLKLKNPIVVGSCGLTGNIDSLKRLEDNGAAAVVLKSLFEEQLHMHAAHNYSKSDFGHTEAYDYISRHTKDTDLENYLQLISDAKSSLDIPVIASINSTSKDNWVAYTKEVEKAGADALELNVSLLPSNANSTSKENEKIYFDIVEAVSKRTDLPLALKMSRFSAGLANLIRQLCWTKNVDSFTLFNRYYSPDIDINTLKMTSSNVYSSPDEISSSLRWVALLSDVLNNDIAASTGIHNGEAVIKQLLAGATVIQMVSALYKHGEGLISKSLNDLTDWMEQKNFDSIDSFRGKMSFKNADESDSLERIQFMKYFGGIE